MSKDHLQHKSGFVPLYVGQLLNYTLSVLLLYTLKHMITWLKGTSVRHHLPLDDTIFLHRITATVAFLLGIVHTIAHVVLIGEFIQHALLLYRIYLHAR